jgi:hypothetical protein
MLSVKASETFIGGRAFHPAQSAAGFRPDSVPSIAAPERGLVEGDQERVIGLVGLGRVDAATGLGLDASGRGGADDFLPNHGPDAAIGAAIVLAATGRGGIYVIFFNFGEKFIAHRRPLCLQWPARVGRRPILSGRGGVASFQADPWGPPLGASSQA